MSIFRPILRLGSRLYQRIVQRRLDAHTREVAEVLQNVPALRHLSSRARHAMAGAMHRRTYRRGEVLYYEGDPGLGLYVVESGRLRLTMQDGPNHSCELRELEAGEMIGGLSLIGEFERLETAEAVAESRVLGFFEPDLDTVIRRDPQAGCEIVTALGRNVGARHVEVLRCLKEREGRDAAIDVYGEAIETVESSVSRTS